MSNVIQLSDTIFRDLESPSNLSIPQIAYWLRYVGIGKLNDLIDVNIELDDNYDFTPELTVIQDAILTEIYYVNYYNKKTTNSLGANSYDISEDWTTIRESDGSQISRVNYIEKAKVFKQLKDDHQEELDKLVQHYRNNNAIPLDERYI
jgi:hypothetical protein